MLSIKPLAKCIVTLSGLIMHNENFLAHLCSSNLHFLKFVVPETKAFFLPFLTQILHFIPSSSQKSHGQSFSHFPRQVRGLASSSYPLYCMQFIVRKELLRDEVRILNGKYLECIGFFSGFSFFFGGILDSPVHRKLSPQIPCVI